MFVFVFETETNRLTDRHRLGRHRDCLLGLCDFSKPQICRVDWQCGSQLHTNAAALNLQVAGQDYSLETRARLDATVLRQLHGKYHANDGMNFLKDNGRTG